MWNILFAWLQLAITMCWFTSATKVSLKTSEVQGLNINGRRQRKWHSEIRSSTNVMQFASLLDCVKTPRCFDFFSRARYTTNSNEHIAVSSRGHEGTVSRATSVSVRVRRKFPWPKVVPCTESRNWRSKFDKTWILTGHVLHQESRLAMSWILRKKTQANEQCLLSKIDYEVFRKLSFLRTHPSSYFRYSGSCLPKKVS